MAVAVAGLVCSMLASKPLVLYVDPSTERLHLVPSLERRGCEYIMLHSAAAAQAILGDDEEDEAGGSTSIAIDFSSRSDI